MTFFASASANQNDLVQKEALDAGAQNIKTGSGGVEFSGDLETAYRFALTTRCSTRMLLLLYKSCEIESTDQLFEFSLKLPWEQWVTPDMTFSISETVTDCPWVRNSHFAALRLKDAIVERIRYKFDGVRPSVDRDDPDVTFNLHINRDTVSWYVDFAGRELCRRGYRTNQTEAVMSEFLAASLLYRSEWFRALRRHLEDSSQPAPLLLDPFCGSGTIITEAALMATDTAPGLIHTERFAFYNLKIHDNGIFSKVVSELEGRVKELDCRILGWDIDPRAVRITRRNASQAGFEGKFELGIHDFTQTTVEDVKDIGTENGFIVTDPPYGVRLAGAASLERLYSKFGEIIYNLFGGWNITILCGDSHLLGNIDMKPGRTNVLVNGGIECQAAHYYVFSDAERAQMLEKAEENRKKRLEIPLTPGAQMAANRLVKNISSIGKSMQEQGVTCYRLYDADMPEYSAAIDVYENKWISLQEYAAPSTIDPDDAKFRLDELIAATERTTGIPLESIYVKRRTIQKGSNQYTRSGNPSSSHFCIANEGGHKFIVNFQDYLDTGIFLDHRPVRSLIKSISADKRFLNLFCYTATATVYAASGGALSTVSVDASSTYLDWGVKNMTLNGFTQMNHFYYKDDCIEYLKSTSDMFDLIFCDPPTYSNSKSRQSFDVQRDHVYLIRSCMRHLAFGGSLIFSTNFTKFRLSEEISEEFGVQDITESTIGDDFVRNRNIHKCFIITHKTEKAVRQAPHKHAVPRKKAGTPAVNN